MVNTVIPNSHITIYNKYIVSRTETWQRFQIRDVVWQAQKAITNRKDSLAANTITVLIPIPAHTEYLYPKAWQALVSKSGYFTLQENDVIVRGLVTDEITGGFTLTSLKAKYDDVVMISSVDRMDQGSANVQHWEVGCK